MYRHATLMSQGTQLSKLNVTSLPELILLSSWGSTEVAYAVKKTGWETAWERGYKLIRVMYAVCKEYTPEVT